MSEASNSLRVSACERSICHLRDLDRGETRFFRYEIEATTIGSREDLFVVALMRTEDLVANIGMDFFSAAEDGGASLKPLRTKSNKELLGRRALVSFEPLVVLNPKLQSCHVQHPDDPMALHTHMLDKGAKMMQFLTPIKQMQQHTCTFVLYDHDLGCQMVAHH